MADNSIQSYIDSATGLAQRAVNSVTGNSTTEESTQNKANTEQKTTDSATKIGPITADPHTGATAQDREQRATGSWDQTVGSAKESLGNLIGNENLRRQGEDQNLRGKGAEAEGQLKDFGEGAADRVQGGLGKVAAAATGDRGEEEKWTRLHDEGKVRQRGAEADMQRKA
ncbi:putative mismatched base pair and cruciform DNA recognition protein [Aspergillus avenaceus]|uniref:Putative mismatched base pair and cruciform DNA recognition protein n=1 Tax=Aspergillus avenaceus TaxID=36643 RepID=A0A5N6TNE8_ASPAV|nr:putative mismatched base pair and cruciform DNA recognition protein [Aspergillus avenaceus]